MAYTVHQAKTHFSRLIKEAEAGKEVIVMRGNKPVARIVPMEPIPVEPSLPFRLLGAYKGQLHWDEDTFNPMTDEELTASGLGYLLDVPLVPASDSTPKK